MTRCHLQFYKLWTVSRQERHSGFSGKIETVHGTNLQWLRRAEGLGNGRHFPDLFLNQRGNKTAETESVFLSRVVDCEIRQAERSLGLPVFIFILTNLIAKELPRIWVSLRFSPFFPRFSSPCTVIVAAQTAMFDYSISLSASIAVSDESQSCIQMQEDIYKTSKVHCLP